jgi:pyridoxal phosphate enzyme (YggS family)
VHAGEGAAARLAAVRAEVARAAARTRRDPAGVQIIAVAKTFPPAVVEMAFAAGLADIGENYVQEARAKRGAIGGGGVWHLIGTLQRNKVRAALGVFDRVHTVDSPALALDLSREAERAGRKMPVLIQVNVAGEVTKHGVPPEGIEALARTILACPALALEGLMTVAPAAADPERTRPHFRRLRELRDAAEDRLGVELPHLSMGMSDDFVIAVEEGATFLRLGRALFGPRGRIWREGA